MKRSIGVDLKAPEEDCGSGSCAWHGSLSVRGRVFRGVVRSAKSHNTAIIEWGYDKYVTKYERYERRKSRVTAHNPSCIKAKEGDAVVIGECRPLSKTKHFVILAKVAEGMFEIKGEDLVEKPKKKAEEVNRDNPEAVRAGKETKKERSSEETKNEGTS
jgi:small subunit ribosomal protein S17